MKFLAAIVLILAASLRVESATCEGKCNIVVCGQSTGGPNVDSMKRGSYYVAESLKSDCYYSPTCGDDCNIGSVFYRDVAVADNSVCDMVTEPLATEEEKYNCMRDARSIQDTTAVTDNKLELCFQRLNTDSALMATTNAACKYTVVVVASDQLTNSDAATLKTQAAQLKTKGATIHCYLVGTSAAVDADYADVCDITTRLDTYMHFHTIMEKLYGNLNCCPGQ